MIPALLGAALATASPVPASPPPWREIDRAIAMHRFEQARLMISAAVRSGASGAAVERPLASLAFATGRNEEALARFEALIPTAPNDALLLEQASIAAIKVGRFDVASRFAERAVRQPVASWRAWNAKGVLADRDRDWAGADEAYARAEALAPNAAEVANNRGWSRILRGDWAGAAKALARAAKIDPRSSRIANNLDLARIGEARDLPARRPGDTSAVYAARLNDAGIAAQAQGDAPKARAAFAQAIEASGSWYARADANLARVEGRE